MNRLLLSIFAVTACFAIAHGLQCYKCNIGFWDLCITTKITCSAGESCFSGEGEAAKVMKIKKKGCLENAKCNMTSEVNFPSDSNTTVYKMKSTCCGSDLCNAAPGLPHISILPLALATLLTVITAKALV
ncbi:sperm acrosome membrane-associated protein 4 [Alosa sapidissima]|uniref:sperm acrosome membrane-associated protein 4 n=1 Tax=Alosa sapidissima TaxID=34773 RepID=UPI001C0947BC|nr:sperm acrosome membrane-associated protein 4 [Alosa sapidissima]